MVPGQEAISIVIPTWNGREHLTALLPTIAAQTLQPLEVLVIDGASRDGSREVAESFGARFVELEDNLGFAAAVNRGLCLAQGAFMAVLNNDLKLSPLWLAELVAVNAPFACGKVLRWDQPTLVDATWDLLSRSGIPLRSGSGKRDSQYWNRRRKIAMAPWTAILLRRDYWSAVGPLDENFESYLEDVDYGLRSRLLGFTGTYRPSALAWHRGSATLGEWHPRQVRLTARNQLRLVAKHGGSAWLRLHGAQVLVGQLLWGIAAMRHGRGGDWLAGKFEACREWKSGAADPKLHDVLLDLDAELFSQESASGMDRFWRTYWALL